VRTTTLLIAFAILASALLAQAETQPTSKPAMPKIPADTEVKTTPSGIKYCVLKEVTPGGKSPTANDRVTVNYWGWLTDGTLFDSSDKQGHSVEFPLRRVIKGWTEGVQLMTPGAKFKFTIPGELAYGKAGFQPDIPPDATLVFVIELLSFVPGPAPLPVPDFPKIDESKLTTTKSGLKYEEVKAGEGKSPASGEPVKFHFALWLQDGKAIQNSYELGDPITIPAGGAMIGAWNEALLLMKPGSVFRLVAPPALGFGPQARGPIPANSTLIWQLELMKQ
jgi:FKBP-type peptidyl-prolyl cis-trans isomerase